MCCERCSAASHDERSCSVNGNIACRVQHRSSMGVAFDSFIHTIVLDKIMIVSGVEYIKDVLFLGGGRFIEDHRTRWSTWRGEVQLVDGPSFPADHVGDGSIRQF